MILSTWPDWLISHCQGTPSTLLDQWPLLTWRVYALCIWMVSSYFILSVQDLNQIHYLNVFLPVYCFIQVIAWQYSDLETLQVWSICSTWLSTTTSWSRSPCRLSMTSCSHWKTSTYLTITSGGEFLLLLGITHVHSTSKPQTLFFKQKSSKMGPGARLATFKNGSEVRCWSSFSINYSKTPKTCTCEGFVPFHWSLNCSYDGKLNELRKINYEIALKMHLFFLQYFRMFILLVNRSFLNR